MAAAHQQKELDPDILQPLVPISILANQEELARLMTAEQGKPPQPKRDLKSSMRPEFIEWLFAEEGKRIYGDVIPVASGG